MKVFSISLKIVGPKTSRPKKQCKELLRESFPNSRRMPCREALHPISTREELKGEVYYCFEEMNTIRTPANKVNSVCQHNLYFSIPSLLKADIKQVHIALKSLLVPLSAQILLACRLKRFLKNWKAFIQDQNLKGYTIPFFTGPSQEGSIKEPGSVFRTKTAHVQRSWRCYRKR